MLKKFLKGTLIILVIGFISAFVRGYKYQYENSSNIDKPTYDTTLKQEMIDENTIQEILEQEKVDSTISNKEINTKAEEKNKNIKTENITNNENISKPKNDTNNQTQSSVNKNTPEPPKKIEIWDSLGISEYDYYNSPAKSWSLDFKVSDYGNAEKTLLACKTYGDTYQETHEVRYRCTEMYSHSGNYLGEHISFFELES